MGKTSTKRDGMLTMCLLCYFSINHKATCRGNQSQLLNVGSAVVEGRRIEVRTLAEAGGMSGAQIIAKTRYSRSFVYEQLANMKKGKSIHDRPRSGRPKKISNRVRKRVVKMCKGKQGMSTRKVASILGGENVKIGRESVRLILRVNGLMPHRQVPKPKLTEEHMERRLAFAKTVSPP